MARLIILWIGLIVVLGTACTQRLTCPAFQSAYIYDKEALRRKFSYFKEDSTPKVLSASKTKYLIIVPESYRKKVRSLNTVEMSPVYPQIPDSLKVEEGAGLLLAETDVPDSLSSPQEQQGLEKTDSAYAITKTKEKYNVDQDNYMWYFRDLLVLPDVRAAVENKNSNKKRAEKEKLEAEKSKEKKGRGGFKNLFRRKQKSDSTSVDAPAIPGDEAADTKKAKTKTPKVKKPKKDKVKKSQKEEPPAKKKEEEDDGFGFS